MIKPFVNALQKEIKQRNQLLRGETVTSIYWGGGTPGLLTPKQLEALFTTIYDCFTIHSDAEITLEANPDDIDKEYLDAIGDLPTNRFSLGVQSFDDRALKQMNRSHSATEAIRAIELVVPEFPTTTIDLIYGRPDLSKQAWRDDLRQAQALGIGHLSCYALTVEEGTKLAHDIRKGKHQKVDDDLAADHFNLLTEWACANHWNHYEISNLCKPGFEAKHNSGYWSGMRYLGFGPGAHSYTGTHRLANKADLFAYNKAWQKGEPAWVESEPIYPAQRFNELVMTGLRTARGIDLTHLLDVFPTYYTT